MHTFYKKLKLERLKKELDITNISTHLNISKDAYRKYEQGNREPDLDTLVKIANYLETSIDYLLGRFDKN